MDKPTLTKETVEVSNFIWNDKGKKLPAGELLSALITLSDSEKETNVIENDDVADYLSGEGYVLLVSGHEFKVNQDKKKDLIDLGNQVSDMIDKELESCIDKKIEPVPTILIMPVPIGDKCDCCIYIRLMLRIRV